MTQFMNDNRTVVPDPKTEVNLKLTVDDISFILRILSEKPFKEVYELVGKINYQASTQIQNSKNDSNKQ